MINDSSKLNEIILKNNIICICFAVKVISRFFNSFGHGFFYIKGIFDLMHFRCNFQTTIQRLQITYAHIYISKKYLFFMCNPIKLLRLQQHVYSFKHNGIPAHISQKFKDLFILYLFFL